MEGANLNNARNDGITHKSRSQSLWKVDYHAAYYKIPLIDFVRIKSTPLNVPSLFSQ